MEKPGRQGGEEPPTSSGKNPAQTTAQHLTAPPLVQGQGWWGWLAAFQGTEMI